MLRILAGSALKGISCVARIAPAPANGITSSFATNTCTQKCLFSSLQVSTLNRVFPTLLQGVKPLAPTGQQLQPTRSVTKFSLIKGKRKSVKAVIKRFRRLDWGAWIRTYTGRQKKLFKKSAARKRRLRQHVFTNSTQSFLLDKMVTSFWRRPKNWIDDVYGPYHKRDEFFATKGKTFKV